MATEIVGCGKSFTVGERIVTNAQQYSGHEVIFDARHVGIVDHCGIVAYPANLMNMETKQTVGRKLWRALCRECAVKDGLAW